MTIARHTATDYAVVTDTRLSDGTLKADDCMRLSGSVLRSHEQHGHLRIGGLLTVNLGPVSLAKVHALAIGEAVTV